MLNVEIFNQSQPQNYKYYASYDVVIIGSGLTGSLITHAFLDKGIDCAFIDIPTTSTISEPYQMDQELQRLSRLTSQDEVDIIFKGILDAIYMLDNKINQLDGTCDYFKNPSMLYAVKDHLSGFEIYPGLLTYYSGIQFNTRKLTRQLKKDAINKMTPIYEHSHISSLSINDNDVVITTSDIREIKSKKIVISSDIILNDFFRSPYNYEIKQDYEDNTKVINQNSLTSDSSYYLGEIDDYPHVYFSIGNQGVLNGLIGGNYLSDLYLNFQQNLRQFSQLC